VTVPRLRGDPTSLGAPAENGAVLFHPPLADFASHLERNRDEFADSPIRLGEASLSELRCLAIAEIIATARSYVAERGEPVPDLRTDSLLVAGHQPDLFHAGVWLKNFALNALAERHGATPLNLVVDNDTLKYTTVRVPVIGSKGDPTTVHHATVPFDHFAGEVPFEERTVQDEQAFTEFPRTFSERTANWSFSPILPQFWCDVMREKERTPFIGERFAAARRTWERRWGCHNLELPISRLCGTQAFAQFAVALIARLPDFHSAYNESVHDYRRHHRIRSPNHPVPDLQMDGDWLEAPFWAWPIGGQRRGRLFVRSVAGGWQMRLGDQRLPDLPERGAAERWQRLEADGFKVRTRALTTTLFARLCLADLFIHGIGGGKYDELTDTIIARHFGFRPPAFLVLTGTLRLPLPSFPASANDERAAWRLVRDIHWNPQRHLPPDAEDWQDMIEARQAVTVQSDSTWRKERFKELRRLTERIRPRVADIEEVMRQKAMRASADVAGNAILQRRDYAFCQFPESTLRPFLTQFTSLRR
jgi:hypothetical protein